MKVKTISNSDKRVFDEAINAFIDGLGFQKCIDIKFSTDVIYDTHVYSALIIYK